MTVLVNLIVMLGMCVVVPLGLTLVDGPETDRLRRIWPAAAAPGAVALWLPRGPLATGLAAVYAASTLLLATRAPLR